jgi:lipopolysaccharide transport system ATP-binding protein
MNQHAISVRHLSKGYQLGMIGRHTLVEEAQYWWHKARGRDPRAHFSKIGHPDAQTRKLEAEPFWALKDVSFDVEQGTVIGIIGHNGAGKSTLLKILTRITEPTSGEAFINGRVASLLEVGTGFHLDLTGRENVYMNGTILGMKRREIAAKFDEIVAFSELEQFIDTPVKRYSSGMFVRLAFAVAAHLEPEILLIDEVLAVGDVSFQKKCLGKMGEVAKTGRTILFVSHNIAAIENLCEKCLLLQNGAVVQQGPTKPVIAHYLRKVLEPVSEAGGLAETTARSGSGVVMFTGFHLEDVHGHRLPAVQSGSDVVLAFQVHNRAGRPLRCVDVGFTVHDSTGSQLLSILYSSYQNREFELSQARGCVRCHIAKLPLAAGRYRIGARLTAGKAEADSPKDSVGWLDVVEGDFYESGRRGFGARAPLLLKGEWSLDERRD